MKKIVMAFLFACFAFSQSSLVAIPPALGESVHEINQILTSEEFQEASTLTEFVVKVVGDKKRDESTFYEGHNLHYRIVTVTPKKKNIVYDVTYNLTSTVGPSVVEVTKIVRNPKKN